MPSVTTVLDATRGDEKKAALAQWRDRVGHERAKQITSEAAARGTRMHSYLESYVATGVLKERSSNPYSWASHAMAETVIANGLANVNEIWGVEVSLFYPKLYAGTCDSVGVHLNEAAIIDYKQTNKEKKQEWIDDYFLQLVSYMLAHNELYGTNIKKGVIMMCVKPELNAQFEQIEPPRYQEFVLEEKDFAKWEKQWWQRLEQYYLQR